MKYFDYTMYYFTTGILFKIAERGEKSYVITIQSEKLQIIKR